MSSKNIPKLEADSSDNNGEYFFHWNNFEESIKNSYQELREKNMFCDVTISCENSEVEAHKVILATGSSFFRNLLERNSFRNHHNPIIHIKDVQMRDMKYILDFLYTGAVGVPQAHIQSLLEAAKELGVKGLNIDNPFNGSYLNDENPIKLRSQKRSHDDSVEFSPERSLSLGSWIPSSSSPIPLQPKIKIKDVKSIKKEKGDENQENNENYISRKKQRMELVEKVGVGLSARFKCKECPYTSDKVSNIEKHAEGHLSPDFYKCHLCPSTFGKEVNFKAHINAKHSVKNFEPMKLSKPEN